MDYLMVTKRGFLKDDLMELQFEYMCLHKGYSVWHRRMSPCCNYTRHRPLDTFFAAITKLFIDVFSFAHRPESVSFFDAQSRLVVTRKQKLS